MEDLAFQFERVLTTTLTPSWMYGCYSFSFLVHSKESYIFKTSASITCPSLAITNMIFFFSYLFGPFLAKALPASLTCDQFTKRKKCHDIERLGFWNERFAMLLVFIYGYLYHPYATTIAVCCLPCMVLFPLANIVYFEWFFIFGQEDEENEVEEKEVNKGSDKQKLDGRKREITDTLIKDKFATCDHVENPMLERTRSIHPEDGDNISGRNIQDQSCSNDEIFGDEVQEKHDEEESKEMETDRNSNIDTVDGSLPGVEEVSQSEEKQGNDESWLQDHELELAELIEERDAAVEKYGEMMDECEKIWARKLENEKNKYMKDCEKWKEQEKDLLYKVSSASSEAQVYKVQATESEEKIGKLEVEKYELITKLNATNATSQNA